MGVGARVLYGAPGEATVGDRLVVGKESGAAGVDKRSRLSSWPTCFRARLLGIQPRSQAARQGPGRAGLVGSRQPLHVVTDFPFYGFLIIYLDRPYIGPCGPRSALIDSYRPSFDPISTQYRPYSFALRREQGLFVALRRGFLAADDFPLVGRSRSLLAL